MLEERVYTGAVSEPSLSNFIFPRFHQASRRRRSCIGGSNYMLIPQMPRSRNHEREDGGEVDPEEYLELGHSEWGSLSTRSRCNRGCEFVLSNVVGRIPWSRSYREYKNRAPDPTTAAGSCANG